MPERPWILEHGLAVISGTSLGLPRPTVDEVVGDVRQFHRDSAVAVLLRLNLALTHHTPLDQEALVRSWLPDLADRFLAVMREQGTTVVFYEPQVLNLIRLMLLFAEPETGRRCDRQDDFTRLARLLLQVTDFLTERDPRVDSDARAWVFGNFTRTELFMYDEHRVPEAMARNYDLFVLIPRLLNRRGYVYDLPGTFTHITGGLGIEDYIGLGFGLLSHYDTIEAGVVGHAAIGINKATYLDNVRLAADIRTRLWPLVSKPLVEYQAALQAEWDTTTITGRWSAMRTFTQFPMIELPDGTVVALSRRLLRDRITHGIYWIMANGVPGGQRQAFTNFFGHVFEAYVCRCLIRAAGREFLRRIEYDGADDGKRPEGALVSSRSVAFVEAKARRLLLNVREIGGEAELRAAVEPGLEEAAVQLAAAIDAGQRRTIKAVETDEATRYYPVVVTYEPLPAHPLALRLYEDVILRNGRLRGRNIKPVTLLNARDIEALEAIIWNGGAWPDLLTRKHTPRHVDDSFHNYLYRVFNGAIPRNEYLRMRWHRVGDLIGTRLFGETLDHSGDTGPVRLRRRRRLRR
jgi:hypothetical protein